MLYGRLSLEEADLRSYGVCSKLEIPNFEFRSANRLRNLKKGKKRAVCRISLKPNPDERDPWPDVPVLISLLPPLLLRVHFSPSVLQCPADQLGPPSNTYTTPPPHRISFHRPSAFLRMSAYYSSYPDYTLFSPSVCPVPTCPSSIPPSHTDLPRPISRNTRQSFLSLIMSILRSPAPQPSPSPTSTPSRNPPSCISTSLQTPTPACLDLTTPAVRQTPDISPPRSWSRANSIRARPVTCGGSVRTPAPCPLFPRPTRSRASAGRPYHPARWPSHRPVPPHRLQ